MSTQSVNTFDPTSDIYEVGLIAAASPDLAAAMLRALLAADEAFKASCEPADASTAGRFGPNDRS
jgi:hypothetical protein